MLQIFIFVQMCKIQYSNGNHISNNKSNKEADEANWKKLLRLMGYLKGTKDIVLTLEADNFEKIHWFVDGSHAVHADMKGHTGGAMTLGKGSIYNKSTKKK